MGVKWMTFFLLVGAAFASAESECDTKEANLCYTDLVHYEGLLFPLYGGADGGLEDACGHINASFECIEAYAVACMGHPECGEECKSLVGDINIFLRNSGLASLSEELCKKDGVLRETYLENYECLLSNADKYSACHNTSQLSQDYIASIDQPDMIEARCCYISWYTDCFTNATSESCSTNATFFVSFSLHKLLGHVVYDICASMNISCTEPPMPPEEPSLTTDKPGVVDNDVGNTIDSSAQGLSSCTLHLLILAYCMVAISKCLL